MQTFSQWFATFLAALVTWANNYVVIYPYAPTGASPTPVPITSPTATPPVPCGTAYLVVRQYQNLVVGTIVQTIPVGAPPNYFVVINITVCPSPSPFPSPSP